MYVIKFDFDIVAVSVLIPNDFYQLKRFAAFFWPVVTQKRKNKEIVLGLVIYKTYLVCKIVLHFTEAQTADVGRVERKC